MNEIEQILILFNASRQRAKQLESEIKLLRSESGQIETESVQIEIKTRS
jgi:hypothetical protein